MSTIRDLARRIARIEQQIRSRPSLNDSSIDGGRVAIFDRAGRLSGLLGRQADGTIALTTIGGPPPPTPVAPTVTAAPAALVVSHTGAFVDGAPAPANFAHFEIHVGPLDGFEASPATVVGTFAATGVTKTVALPVGVQVFVAVAAISTSGVRSPLSAYVPGTPQQVVDAATVAQIELDVAEATAAGAEALAATQNITTTQISDNAITTAKLMAESVVASKLAANSVLAASIKAGEVTAGKLAAEAVIAGNLAANSVLAGNIAVGAVTAGTISAAAIDGMTITGALIRTAATGVRCELSNFTDSSGINGELRFTTSTGHVSRIRATIGSPSSWTGPRWRFPTGGYGLILASPRKQSSFDPNTYIQGGLATRINVTRTTGAESTVSAHLGVDYAKLDQLDADFVPQGISVSGDVAGATTVTLVGDKVVMSSLDEGLYSQTYLQITGGTMTARPNRWHYVGEAGEIPFTNGWQVWGSTYMPPRWRIALDGGIELDGMMKSGTTGNAAFTLPSSLWFPLGGYTRGPWIVSAHNGAARLQITSDGGVVVHSYIAGGTDSYVSLAGVAVLA